MLKNTPVFLTIELADKNTRPWEVKMKTVTHVQKKLDKKLKMSQKKYFLARMNAEVFSYILVKFEGHIY